IKTHKPKRILGHVRRGGAEGATRVICIGQPNLKAREIEAAIIEPRSASQSARYIINRHVEISFDDLVNEKAIIVVARPISPGILQAKKSPSKDGAVGHQSISVTAAASAAVWHITETEVHSIPIRIANDPIGDVIEGSAEIVQQRVGFRAQARRS